MSPPGSTLDEEPFLVDSPPQNEDVQAEGGEGNSSEDEDDDDDDDDDDKEVSVNKKFDEITRDLKDNNIDLRDPAQLEDFAARNASYLSQKTTGDGDHNTLLHLLIEDAKDKAIDRYQPLVKRLIDLYPDLLGEKDSNEKTPLYLAIYKKRDKLVRAMCDAHPNIDAILNIPCSHSENCLHVAIRRNVSPKLAIFLIKHASEDTLCAKDDKGNTPLHLAVDYERCTDEQREIVETLIDRCNKAMDERTNEPTSFSPYRYHEYTRAKAAEAEAETKKAAKEKEKEAAQGKKDGSSAAGGDGPGGRDAAGAKSKVAPQGKDVKVPKLVTGSKGQGMPVLGKDLGRIELLRRVNTSSEAPLGKDRPNLLISIGVEGSRDVKGLNPKTPVAAESSSRRKKAEKKEVKVTEESAGMIRDYLKLHCMRTRNEEDAIDFLYGRNQGMSLPSPALSPHNL
jgi:hypothetical protein